MKNTPVLDEQILRTPNSGARLAASIMLELRPLHPQLTTAHVRKILKRLEKQNLVFQVKTTYLVHKCWGKVTPATFTESNLKRVYEHS